MKSILHLSIFLFLLNLTGFAQPNEIQDLIAKGMQFHDAGNYKQALESYQKALKIDSSNQVARYELANSYFALKEYKIAYEQGMKLIQSNSKYKQDAYILAGSCLDLMQKPKEAVALYQEGIKSHPGNYLLYYNLGLTQYKMQNFTAASASIQEGLKLKPNHPGSHLLLGFIQKEQQHRIKAVLCLYNFLFLEPNEVRTKNALNTLNSLLKSGVTQSKENEIQIQVPINKNESDEFNAAEMMISLLAASSNIESNKKKTVQELFVDNTKSLFTVLGELKKEQRGFWWNFYVDYFYDMVNKNHVEAFCYFIMQSKEDKQITEWLSKNEEKIRQLIEWDEAFKRVSK